MGVMLKLFVSQGRMWLNAPLAKMVPSLISNTSPMTPTALTFYS